MMEKKELVQYIKAEATRLGFDLCGIAKAGAVSEESAEYCKEWVKQGKNGTMQ